MRHVRERARGTDERTNLDLLVCAVKRASAARTRKVKGSERRRRTRDEALQVADVAVEVAALGAFEVGLLLGDELRARGREL